MDQEPTDQEDTDVSTSAPKKRKSPAFWISRIEAAKEQSKPSWDLGKMAWEEYLGPTNKSQDARDSVNAPSPARYPIYWSSVKSIQPMLYSRTPIPVAEKVFDDLEDDVARVACLSLERLAKYLIRPRAFDSTMSYMRDTFIHYGKATCRVYFEAEINETAEKIYFIQKQVPAPQEPPQPGMPPAPPQMMSVWVDDRGDTLQDPSQLQPDERGMYLEAPALDEVSAKICPIHYRDYLHTPNARWEEEITWKAYKNVLTADQFRDKFGKVEGVKFLVPKDNERTPADAKSLKDPAANIWEIWDCDNEEVLWLAEGKKDAFLTPLMSDGEAYEGGDPYELDGFYPSPSPVTGTTGPDGLFPVPDFVQLRPFIDQLHGLADRLQVHVRALKTIGIYDASYPALKEAIDGLGSGSLAAMKNFAELVDTGGSPGLEKIIRFFPMQEISGVVTQLMQVIQDYEAKFNEIWGLPDILRGASEPGEGYQKQQQKGEWMSLRATVPGRSFQRVVRDAIELMCDLAISKFPEKKLQDVCGVRYMKQEEQAIWPDVLLLLQDDDERKVRINIQTDSTITMNESAEIEQRQFTAKTITDGFAAIATAIEQDKDFGPSAIQSLIDVVSGTQKGKGMEGMLRALQKKKQEEFDAPPAPPPPDPKIQVEQMKQQGKMQELQVKGQLDQQKMQGDFQIAQSQAQSQMAIEQMQAQADIQTVLAKIRAEIQQSQIEGAAKIQIEQNLAGLEAKLKILEASLKIKEHQTSMAHDTHSAALDIAAQAHAATTDSLLANYEARQKVMLMNKEAQAFGTEKTPQ